mgnify:FL=1
MRIHTSKVVISIIQILVVDDEAIIREGIIKSIDWGAYSIEIAGEAANGKEALDFIQISKPDIIITDIRMPVIDGLELAKRLQKLIPPIKLIILTGYGEFEYAQKAIEYKVSDFILKPVGAEELIKVVLKLKDEIIAEREKAKVRNSNEAMLKENLPVIQGKMINRLLNGLYTIEDTDKVSKKAKVMKIDLSGPYFQVFIIAIDDYIHQLGNSHAKNRELVLESILSISEEAISSYGKGYLHRNEMGMFVGIINRDRITFDIVDMCRQIQFLISKHLKLSVSIGIGNKVKDILSICKSYNEAFNALRNRVYSGKSSVIHIRDISMDNECASIMYMNSFSKEEKELQIYIKLIDRKKINNLLDRLFKRFVTEKADYNCIRNISLYFMFAAFKDLKELGINVEDRLELQFDPFIEIEKYETAEEMKKWMISVFSDLLHIIENEKNEKYKYIVKVGIDYMINHYNEPLSLTIIADEVHVTPNYFSRVFREETGQNFIEWLNKFRVDKAKDFLLNIGMKTYEVAEKVGFSDYKHFSYNFKKYAGCNPTEYREMNA